MTATRPATAGRTRRRTVALVLGLATLLTPACDAVGGAVDDARQAVEGAQEAVSEGAQLVQYCVAAGRVAQAVQDEDVDAAVAAGQDLVEHAPDEVRADAERLLAGARQAQDGNMAALREEEFQASARRVAEHAADRCDPR